MLKFVLFLQLLIISSISLANSSVGNFSVINNPEKLKAGTVFVRDVSQIKQGSETKAIYAIGRQSGVTEFAIANAVANKWEIQKYAVPDSVLENSEFSQLINQSSSAKEWVEIQK